MLASELPLPHFKAVHTNCHELALKSDAIADHINLSRLQQRCGLAACDEGGRAVGPQHNTYTTFSVRAR